MRLTHAIVVLDLAKPDRPVEAARVTFDSGIFPHWTAYDARTHRVAVTGSGENRLYLLTFDTDTGAIAMDKAFHDEAGRPGFEFNEALLGLTTARSLDVTGASDRATLLH